MIAWWWLIVVLGAGVFIGALVMACCSLAGCTDCRLAAKAATPPAITYHCELTKKYGVFCIPSQKAKPPGAWCEEEGPGLCQYLRKEGERCDAS